MSISNPIFRKTLINFQTTSEDINSTHKNGTGLTPDLESKLIGPSESKKHFLESKVDGATVE
jgi:hypothetical protein